MAPSGAPPGTILQQLYLHERLRNIPSGTFVEVGVGRGLVSSLLLRMGWRGVGYDMGDDSVAATSERNGDAIADGRYEVRQADWLGEEASGSADLVVSSMVVEHLVDDDEARYFQRCAETLTDGGMAVLLVPASPKHWGIEDDVAGHVRRYTRHGLERRLDELGWDVRHLAGLTYPLSNILLPVSNFLVRRAEQWKMTLDQRERTKKSGVRDIRFKTTFPNVLSMALNDRTLYPFHMLQKACRQRESALVLYAEAVPRRG